MKTLSTFAKMPLFSSLIVSANTLAGNGYSIDLLNGVSGSRIEALSDSEAADTRGERIKFRVGVPSMCGMETMHQNYYQDIHQKNHLHGPSLLR